MPPNAPEIRADRWWTEPRARPLVVLGAVMVASGILHLPVWACCGGPWEGPVSWRKPILFGISGGLTAVSLGWVWTLVPPRRGDAWLAAATAWALLVEVFLIDLQRWRGVASHFNRDTPLDSFLFDAMGALIVAVTLVIADLTWRLLMRRPEITADMRIAARAGMALLLISCVLGIWVGMHGETRVQQGLDPTRLGAAGVPKFPHGVVIHAVQWLPALAWALRRASLAEKARVRLVVAAAAGSALLLAYAVVQTALGRARFDATAVTVPLIAVSLACLAAPVVVLAAAAVRQSVAPLRTQSRKS